MPALSDSRLRRGLQTFALVASSVLATLALLEGAVRVHLALTRNQPGLGQWDHLQRMPLVLDGRLGWRPTPDYRFSGSEFDAAGQPHSVSVTQDEHGFRHSSRRLRGPVVLAIGDSYTQAVEVSDEQTFVALLEARLPARFFAAGGSGWSTLQELLFLDDHLDRLRPDVLLWQFSDNDFLNNYYPLERRWAAATRTIGERPYLEGDAIRLRVPRPFGPLVALGKRYTYLWDFVEGRIVGSRGPIRDELLPELAAGGLAHPQFAQAMDVTDRLFARLRARVGPLPVIAFAADRAGPPFSTGFEQLAARHGFRVVEGIGRELEQRRLRGEVVLARDEVHYSAAGHAAIADRLAPAVAAALAEIGRSSVRERDREVGQVGAQVRVEGTAAAAAGEVLPHP